MTELQTIILSAGVGAIVAILGHIVTYFLNQQSANKQAMREAINTDI